MLCALFATVMTGSLSADHQAALIWRGEIDGPTRLRIQGSRVDTEGSFGQLRATPDYRFSNPLPAVRQDVQVLVRQGRADARVLEQPRPNNNFTALVEVRPRRRNVEPVTMEFFWQHAQADARNRRYDPYGEADRPRYRIEDDDTYGVRGGRGAGQLVWSGRVDHEAMIEIRRRQATARTIAGQPVYGDRAEFSGALPRQNVIVRLEDARGRGRISLAEQPNASNGYTAKVHIQDPEGGAGDYSFVLSWDDTYTGNEGYQQSPVVGPYSGYGSGQMLWSGRVDGRIRVIVQGNRSWVERVSGGPVQGVRADFSAPFDGRSGRQVSVRRLRGRDEVRVVEQPSPGNGYRLVFEIDDNDSGADDYQVQVSW
jgi:hypothetical protein